MVRLRRLRGQLPGPTVLVALAATLSAAVAGCATAPSGGAPRQAPGANSQVQAYVQPLPGPGPTSSWYPRDVVLGFLHASASYAFDPAAARKFLVPSLRKRWHPSRGVVVVRDTPTVTPVPRPIVQGPGTPGQFVKVTGQPLAALSQSGQYENATGQTAPDEFQFVLVRVKGVLLIKGLAGSAGSPQPLQTLILTESDFQDVYQPRNLYFWASGPGFQDAAELVPDPVYAPIQSSNSALNTDLATGLVNGLLNQPLGWLDGVATTDFPPGTRLLSKVTITGKTAHVDLGGAVARAVSVQPALLNQMAYQVAATLGDPSDYSQQLASRVVMSINHKQQGSPVYLSDAADDIPSVLSGPVQMTTGTSSVAQLAEGAKGSLHGGRLQPRLAPAQIESGTITALAASPAPVHPLQLAVAVQHGGGCTVYAQPAGQGQYKPYPLTTSGGPCRSLSYDVHGNLWAAAGARVWVLLPSRAPVAVSLANMTAAIQRGDEILGLRIAPDAVRAALLVKTPAGNQLQLAAVHVVSGSAWFGQPVAVGASLPDDPVAISWYDPYHLAVLTGEGIYDLPLTTGAGRQPPSQLANFSTLPGTPLAMTTDRTNLVAGTTAGVFAETPSTPTPEWAKVADGTNPIYPG